MEAEEGRIRDVYAVPATPPHMLCFTFCSSRWSDNMSEEFACIRQVARSFPYVSMDTEFPGVVAKPTGTFRNNSDYQCGRVHAPAYPQFVILAPNRDGFFRQVSVFEGECRHAARHSNRHHVFRRRRQLPHRHALHVAVSLFVQPAERYVRATPAQMSILPPPPTLRPRSYAEDSIQLLRTAGHPALHPLSTAHTNTATLVLSAGIDFTYKTRFQY